MQEDIAQVMKTAETLLAQCGIQITSEGELLPAEPTTVHLGEEVTDCFCLLHQMLII